MNYQSLLIKLGKLYPKKLALENNDYVGVMVPTRKKEINRIVLCLDFDETIYQEVKDFNTDLIITHHPFIYGNKNLVLNADTKKQKLYNKLLKDNIGLVSYHTNFDAGDNGMNDALSMKLELNNIYKPSNCSLMRIGELSKEMEINEFAKYVKSKLNASYATLLDYGKSHIKKVAIIGGGGAGYYHYALEEGADIYLSGDIPHHIRRAIILDKFNYLDLPHEIERVFMNKMKEVLLKLDSKLIIKIIDHEKEAKIII